SPPPFGCRTGLFTGAYGSAPPAPGPPTGGPCRAFFPHPPSLTEEHPAVRGARPLVEVREGRPVREAPPLTPHTFPPIPPLPQWNKLRGLPATDVANDQVFSSRSSASSHPSRGRRASVVSDRRRDFDQAPPGVLPRAIPHPYHSP